MADFPVVGGYPVPCTIFANCIPTSTIYPNVGVTSTPVIDTSTSPPTMYVVSALLPNANSSTIFYFLHAIDVTTGKEKPNSPTTISAAVSGVGSSSDCTSGTGTGTLTFNPNLQLQRPGLLLLPLSGGGNAVYIGFSLYDGARTTMGTQPTGWVMGYTYGAGGFTQVGVFNTAPNGTGSGIWQSGAGLAAETDNNGNSFIYVATADGTFDPAHANYGNSLLKLTVGSSGSLSLVNNPPVYNYFTPSTSPPVAPATWIWALVAL